MNPKELMAFPHCFEDLTGARNWIQSSGMTLRDYFAAKAMQGLITHNPSRDAEDIARWSYEQADAMLRAREVKR